MLKRIIINRAIWTTAALCLMFWSLWHIAPACGKLSKSGDFGNFRKTNLVTLSTELIDAKQQLAEAWVAITTMRDHDAVQDTELSDLKLRLKNAEAHITVLEEKYDCLTNERLRELEIHIGDRLDALEKKTGLTE